MQNIRAQPYCLSGCRDEVCDDVSRRLAAGECQYTHEYSFCIIISYNSNSVVNRLYIPNGIVLASLISFPVYIP